MPDNTDQEQRFENLEMEDPVTNVPAPAMPEGMAVLNVTWSGSNGDLPDPVSYDASDADIRTMAEEAIRTGYIPGIDVDPDVDLGEFVVDRFVAKDELPARVMLRPKVPFGQEPGTTLLERNQLQTAKDIIIRELTFNQAIVVPGLGKFYTSRIKVSGKAAEVGGRLETTAVRFKPSEVIKRAVRSS